MKQAKWNLKESELKIKAIEQSSTWIRSFELVECISIKKYDFDLSKEQFLDDISIRYSWPLSSIPTTYDFQNIRGCKNCRLED